MADATPQFDFQKCATPWPVRLTNPTVAVIGELGRVGANVSGMVYSTVQGQAQVGNLLLTCGYGQIFSAAAASGNAITQGEKVYMVDGTTGPVVAPTVTNTEAGNTFVGYALPKDVEAAATDQLVAAGGSGDILVWFRPE